MNDDNTKTINNNYASRGFGSHPENINLAGRPKKGSAWADVLAEIGEEIDERSGKPYKELVSRKLWDKARLGDINAIRELIDRMDGKPTNKTELTGAGGGEILVRSVNYGDYDPLQLPTPTIPTPPTESN